MMEDALERTLASALRKSFAMSQEQEDRLWTRFETRRSLEAAAWTSFAVNMALFSVRLQPAVRSSSWTVALTAKR